MLLNSHFSSSNDGGGQRALLVSFPLFLNFPQFKRMPEGHILE